MNNVMGVQCTLLLITKYIWKTEAEWDMRAKWDIPLVGKTNTGKSLYPQNRRERLFQSPGRLICSGRQCKD